MTETRAILFAVSIDGRPSITLKGPKVITIPKDWVQPALSPHVKKNCPEDFLQARF
jgi:hypothetical protein